MIHMYGSVYIVLYFLTANDEKRRREMAKITLELNNDDLAAFRDVAEELGYVNTRGPGAGQLPNVSAMLRDLALVRTDSLVEAFRLLGLDGNRHERT